MPRQKLNKVRLAIDVPPEVKGRIEAMRVRTEADSMSEVVRRALAVYEALLDMGQRTVDFADGEGAPTRLILW